MGILMGILCALSIAALDRLAPPAHASTEIRWDTSGFPLLADDRPSLATAVSIRPSLEGSTKNVEAKLDVQLITFLNDSQSLSFEGRELYVATSLGFWDKHQLTLGRRLHDWGRLDRAWNLGVLAPRFNWDPTAPETIGMTGFSHAYRHKRWSTTLLASPVSVPERGAPIVERGGLLVSANPFWPEPIRNVSVFEQNVPLQYRMVYPALSELVVHPTLAASVANTVPEGETGVGGRVSYGNLPIHQPGTAMVTKLNPTTGIIEASLHPYVIRHQLLSAEATYQRNLGELGTGALWASVTREWPEQKPLPESWVARDIGPTWISSVGGELGRGSRYSLGVSYIEILEDRADIAEASLLPPRYPFQRAGRLDAHWRPSPRLLADARWIRDFSEQEDMISLDLTYRPAMTSLDQPLRGWILGIGCDFFATSTGTGWIGGFEGDDRVRGRISYAF